jgi:hypothetical protein
MASAITPGNGGNGGNGGTAVKPDIVIAPNGDSTKTTVSAWMALDPCPFCDSSPHDSPEGIHDIYSSRKLDGVEPGDPKWDFPHCWKCGYRPGINQATGAKEMQRQFAAFQDWLNGEQGKIMAGQPSLDPSAQSGSVQAQLDEMKATLDAIKASASNPSDASKSTKGAQGTS